MTGEAVGQRGDRQRGGGTGTACDPPGHRHVALISFPGSGARRRRPVRRGRPGPAIANRLHGSYSQSGQMLTFLVGPIEMRRHHRQRMVEAAGPHAEMMILVERGPARSVEHDVAD